MKFRIGHREVSGSKYDWMKPHSPCVMSVRVSVYIGHVLQYRDDDIDAWILCNSSYIVSKRDHVLIPFMFHFSKEK